MAQTPYRGGVPQIEPSVGVTIPFQRPAPSGAFGEQEAAGREQLGAGLLKAGQFFDEVAADDATNQYMTATRKLLNGDPDGVWTDPVSGAPILDDKGQPQQDRGYFGLEGRAALDARPHVERQLEDLRSQLRSNMMTGRQALSFDRSTRMMQNYMSDHIGRHAETQAHTWAGKVEKASIENDKADLADAALRGDWAQVAIKEKDVISGKVRTASRLGATPELLSAADREGRQESALTQIHALLPTNPRLANQIFERNRELLSSMHGFDALSKTLQNENDKITGLDAGRRAFFGGGGGGGVRRGEVIPYTPGANFLSSTGMTAEKYNTYREHMAGHESSSYSEPPSANPLGYMGRYQMGGAETGRIRGEGFNEVRATARRMGIPEPTTDQFLADPQLQERMFENYTLNHHNELMQQSAEYKNATPERRAAILAGAHLGGVGGVKAFLEKGEDRADANKTRVSQYVASMGQAMGAGAAAPTQLAAAGRPAPAAAAARAPDLDEALSRIPEGLSEGAYDRAHREVTKLWREWYQRTAVDRAQLKTSITSGSVMLEDGREFDYDPDEIRRLLPAQEADQAIDLLENAKVIGQQKDRVSEMSYSQAIQQSVANQAQLDKAPPGEYVKMKRMANAFDVASAKHFKQLFEDPAGVITSTSEPIRALRDQAAQDVATAGAVRQTQDARVAAQAQAAASTQAYATAVLDEQERKQIPPDLRRILPAAEAANIASAIGKADPGTIDIGAQYLDPMAKQYGSHWSKVLGQLVKAGLPAEAQVLATMDNENQLVARQDYQRFINIAAEKGGVEAFKKILPAHEKQAITADLDDNLLEFRKTTDDKDLYETVHKGVEGLALYYVFRGQSGKAAIENAYKNIIGNKYDFSEYLRVPKGTLGVVERAGDAIKAGIKPEDLQTEIPGARGLSPERKRDLTLDAIQRGVWLTNRSDDGAVLYVRTREGSVRKAIKGDGTPIEFKFDEAPRLAAGRAAAGGGEGQGLNFIPPAGTQ